MRFPALLVNLFTACVVIPCKGGIQMKILLTGATGYIGKRMLSSLLGQGHEVICCVRDADRVAMQYRNDKRVSIIEVDFLEIESEGMFPPDIDAAYYLIHSMAADRADFGALEARAATRFVHMLDRTSARQIVYLGGITSEQGLSDHLASRKRVGEILRSSRVPLTELQAGVIIGSGSASFEIMRDLVEKLPVMIAPKWLNTRHQPIAVRDVLLYLRGVLGREECAARTFHIGGPDVLTYKEMLQKFAEVRGLKRLIATVPVMTPRLSSYWLYFITATSYRLAVALVDSMKIEVVARENELERLLGITPLSYTDAVRQAFRVIEQDAVPSSWKDAISSSSLKADLSTHIEVPEYGCFRDERSMPIPGDIEQVMENIWSIGGERGWYYGNLLWRIRGVVDKLAGGVGLRRGRTLRSAVNAGDAIDFWRVLVADTSARRLLLFAEMKLPGEAWLEFRIVESDGQARLTQTATFRPRGLSGRLYWYSVLPVHALIFNGMCRNIISYRVRSRISAHESNVPTATERDIDSDNDPVHEENRHTHTASRIHE
jgi:uncharacterized protein YbjT (DUF2867 family)